MRQDRSSLVVKIETRDCVTRFWRHRFFLYPNGLTRLIEFDDSVRFGVCDPVREYGCPVRTRAYLLKGLRQILSVKKIVAENERAAPIRNELLGDHQCLSDSLRALLDRVGDRNSPLRDIPEQAFELGPVPRCGDDENVGDAAEHERRERIINQRLVVDWQQLLTHRARHGVQPRARASREYYTYPVLSQDIAQKKRRMAIVEFKFHRSLSKLRLNSRTMVRLPRRSPKLTILTRSMAIACETSFVLTVSAPPR